MNRLGGDWKSRLTIALAAAASAIALLVPAARAESPRLQRLQFNHPGLIVDASVGLWAWPLPMDYDADGDLDLVVSCPDVPANGTYLFENRGERDANGAPRVEPGVRIGEGLTNLSVSFVDDVPRLLAPAVEFRNFPQQQFADGVRLPLAAKFHAGKVRANVWKYCDFDDDGAVDLVIGVEDWADYGWDNAYNQQGEWTNGPLHGYVYLARNLGTNAAPTYAPPMKLQAGDDNDTRRDIDVFGMPSPNLADFDGDGDLDLLCGEFVDRFTYFENVGTRRTPKFRAGRRLQLGGDDLRVDLCMMVPVAADWDGDGHLDLVVGQEDGRVLLFRHRGVVTGGLPQFAAPVYFRQPATDLKFGVLATPVGVDWDHDGDDDLVAGNSAGEIAWLENLDDGTPPRWAAPRRVAAAGQTIRIQAGPNGSIQGPCETKWGYTTLSVADWDSDGLADLVVNSIWGMVVWYRNMGTLAEPRFDSARPIEVAWPAGNHQPEWLWWTPTGNELVTQWRTTPLATDWTGDGLVDLVMLDQEGYLALFRRQPRDGKLSLLPPERLFVDANDQPLRLNDRTAGKSGRRKFTLVDWDGDGLVDLLADARNAELRRGAAASGGRYRFSEPTSLDSRRLAGHDTSPTTVDWNHDGVPELVLGAEDGHFYYLPNPRATAKAASE